MNLKELEDLLSANSIDISQYGQGKAKTLENLLQEIKDGETVLVKEGHVLVREVNVLSIDVFCRYDGKQYRLKEDRQEFTDGREARRRSDYLTDGAVSEKILPGEDLIDAVRRALAEELQVSSFQFLKNPSKTGVKERTSPSYPDLLSRYANYSSCVELHRNEFKHEGYVEEQDDKVTYFLWEETV